MDLNMGMIARINTYKCNLKINEGYIIKDNAGFNKLNETKKKK
jgi:hypothetical protein